VLTTGELVQDFKAVLLQPHDDFIKLHFIFVVFGGAVAGELPCVAQASCC
jgi:hypothetical protein